MAFLSMRMADAHLHMCFDGQEPASSWHVGESEPHHESSGEAGHVDADVAVGVLLLLKAGKLDGDDLPLLLTGVFFLWCLITPRSVGVVGADSAAPV